MKYLRKIIAFLIGIVFFAAVVISIGMIFAIKNINVTLMTYADEETYTESYEKAKNSLESFKGESLVFLREEQITDIFADSNYAVASCEKLYPCTVNVILKERLETFAVSVGGLYSMYDSDGRFLRYAEENNNVNDDSPNVELTSIPVEKITEIADYATTFKSNFGSLRSIVASISIEVNPDIELSTDKLFFNLRCGLVIQIDDFKDGGEEKIAAVYKEFCTLTDRQKLSGTLRGYRIGGEGGVVNANYSPV